MVNKYDQYETKTRDEECQLIIFDLQTPEKYKFDNKEIMDIISSPRNSKGVKISARVYPGDFAHPNEWYPWEVKKNYR